VKDFTPSDFSIGSFAGDGRYHNMQQVLNLRVVDGLCNQA
jgi:hypothetical protein